MLARDVGPRPARRAGISYTEFSYVLLQANDYLQLYASTAAPADRRQRPVGQHHRRHRPDPPGRGRDSVHGLTTPLVTKADGTKFGKTESGDGLARRRA